MAFTWTFLDIFFNGVLLVAPVLLFLSIVIIVLGQIAGRVEGWRTFDSFYWTLITAMTVGYGDMRPTQVLSRLLSIAIALIGIIFTGIWVAIALSATTTAFEQHVDPQTIEALKQRISAQKSHD